MQTRIPRKRKAEQDSLPENSKRQKTTTESTPVSLSTIAAPDKRVLLEKKIETTLLKRCEDIISDENSLVNLNAEDIAAVYSTSTSIIQKSFREKIIRALKSIGLGTSPTSKEIISTKFFYKTTCYYQLVLAMLDHTVFSEDRVNLLSSLGASNDFYHLVSILRIPFPGVIFPFKTEFRDFSDCLIQFIPYSFAQLDESTQNGALSGILSVNMFDTEIVIDELSCKILCEILGDIKDDQAKQGLSHLLCDLRADSYQPARYLINIYPIVNEDLKQVIIQRVVNDVNNPDIQNKTDMIRFLRRHVEALDKDQKAIIPRLAEPIRPLKTEPDTQLIEKGIELANAKEHKALHQATLFYKQYRVQVIHEAMPITDCIKDIVFSYDEMTFASQAGRAGMKK